MKKVWSIIIIVLLVVGVIVGGPLVQRQLLATRQVAAEDATASIPTGTIATGAIQELVSATGSVASERSATLVMTVSGQVEQVSVSEGDVFGIGDLLVKLDDAIARDQADRARASYESALKRLEQAKAGPSEAQIASAEASVAAAEASVVAAEAGVAAAQANLAKLVSNPSSEDVRAAQLSIESAKNSLWSAQANRDATKGSKMANDAAVDAAEAQVLVAEVVVRQAELNLERLYVGPTAEDISSAQAAVDQAFASLDQAKSSVDQTKASLAQLYDQPRAVDIAVSEANLAESQLAFAQAESALQDAILEAPFAGTALMVHAKKDEWMAAGQPVVEIADMAHLELVVLLDEVDVASVAEGQDVTLEFDALPESTVGGKVVDIAPSATQTASGTAFQVTVAFEPGEMPVRLGMTAKVDIVVKSVEDAVLVPNRAVEADRENDQYFVNVKRGLGTQRTEITIGLRDDNYTQVIEGLEAGDEVLLQVIDLGETDQGGFQPPMPPGGSRVMGRGR